MDIGNIRASIVIYLTMQQKFKNALPIRDAIPALREMSVKQMRNLLDDMVSDGLLEYMRSLGYAVISDKVSTKRDATKYVGRSSWEL